MTTEEEEEEGMVEVGIRETPLGEGEEGTAIATRMVAVEVEGAIGCRMATPVVVGGEEEAAVAPNIITTTTISTRNNSQIPSHSSSSSMDQWCL